jgi:teichuronic acid biosynthesis glycosyltransferase TuaH
VPFRSRCAPREPDPCGCDAVAEPDVSGEVAIPSTQSSRLPGDWRGLVAFFAGTAFDDNPFPDQHVAKRLTRWAPVLYVDPPVSIVDRQGGLSVRSPRPALRVVDDRLARLTPVVIPPKTRGPMPLVTNRILRWSAARAARALGGDVAVAIAAMIQPVFGACGERRSVFYATDDFGSGAALMGVSQRWATQNEQAALRGADLVIAISEHLADVLHARGGARPLVIENGVDQKLFAATDDAPRPIDVHLDPPIAGFIGHLSDRIDLSMLEATADAGCSVLLVGPRQGTFDFRRIEALLARPNVQWVGAKPFESLPSYMRVIDVGLLPYADTEFNRSSFPLKVLEYLAAGRPAVSSDLPAVRQLGDEVVVASGPDEFVRAVRAALEAPRDPRDIQRRRAVTATYSWDSVAHRIAIAIGIAGGDHDESRSA